MSCTTLRTLLISFGVLSFSLTSFSQEQKPSAAEGTFQLITSNSKIQEVFTTEILEDIEAHRAKDEIIYHKLSEHTTAKILPYSVIEAPNFVPLKELYTDK